MAPAYAPLAALRDAAALQPGGRLTAPGPLAAVVQQVQPAAVLRTCRRGAGPPALVPLATAWIGDASIPFVELSLWGTSAAEAERLQAGTVLLITGGVRAGLWRGRLQLSPLRDAQLTTLACDDEASGGATRDGVNGGGESSHSGGGQVGMSAALLTRLRELRPLMDRLRGLRSLAAGAPGRGAPSDCELIGRLLRAEVSPFAAGRRRGAAPLLGFMETTLLITPRPGAPPSRVALGLLPLREAAAWQALAGRLVALGGLHPSPAAGIDPGRGAEHSGGAALMAPAGSARAAAAALSDGDPRGAAARAAFAEADVSGAPGVAPGSGAGLPPIETLSATVERVTFLLEETEAGPASGSAATAACFPPGFAPALLARALYLGCGRCGAPLPDGGRRGREVALCACDALAGGLAAIVVPWDAPPPAPRPYFFGLHLTLRCAGTGELLTASCGSALTEALLLVSAEEVWAAFSAEQVGPDDDSTGEGGGFSAAGAVGVEPGFAAPADAAALAMATASFLARGAANSPLLFGALRPPPGRGWAAEHAGELPPVTAPLQLVSVACPPVACS